MSITIAQLQKFLDAQGVKYFQDPNRPVLMAPFSGRFGSYQVLFHVDLDGKFFLMRTLGYAGCPKSHKNCTAVLQVLGDLDYRLRSTKWGWDPTDGEIVACIDLWLEDAKMTEAQFRAIFVMFLVAIDQAHLRIMGAMETGEDPGMPDRESSPEEPRRGADYSTV